MQVHADIGFTFYALTGSLTARSARAGGGARHLMRAGLARGRGGTVVMALLLLGNPSRWPRGARAGARLRERALCGVLVSGIAPVISGCSRTTDVKLLELANREQSLLRELELRAPTTTA